MSAPDFVPKLRLVTNVTNAVIPTVTTSANHGYSADEIVFMYVPNTYGMTIEYKEVKILSVTGLTTFTINLDTTLYDPFVAPGLVHFTPAQVCPVSELRQNVAV